MTIKPELRGSPEVPSTEEAMKKRRRTICPRLANGKSRVGFGHGLPEEIKEGLRRIAYKENQSMAWVMEQVIVEYFGMKTPEYVERKTPLTDEAKHTAAAAARAHAARQHATAAQINLRQSRHRHEGRMTH